MHALSELNGRLLLLLEKLCPSRQRVTRPDDVQAAVDERCGALKLYCFRTCPYCVVARQTIRRLNLNIETRDIRRQPEHGRELRREGGKRQVPCLRIVATDGSVRWLYESSDIGRYLEQEFAGP